MQSSRGLTLAELLCVLAITAILTLIAISGMSGYTQAMKITVCRESIASAIRTGKMLAMARKETLALLPDSATGDWSEGLAIVPGIPALSPEEAGSPVLYRSGGVCAGLGVRWKGIHAPHYLVLSSDPSRMLCNGRFEVSAGTRTGWIIVNRMCHARFAG